MKYFFDTEFIEGLHKPFMGKRRHFIDLISIGIVAEDGRTYSAISSEYEFKKAGTWVQKNVILPLYTGTVFGDQRNHFDVDNFHLHYGRKNDQIAKEIINFINPHINAEGGYHDDMLLNSPYTVAHNLRTYQPDDKCPYIVWRNQPEFYAYYADYDWVLFCSLFGTMIDLPKGYPMYCIDLKQTLDEKVDKIFNRLTGGIYTIHQPSFEYKLDFIKRNDPYYPKQQKEHDALADAEWNRQLDIYLNAHYNQ